MIPNTIYQDLPEQIRQGNCVLVLGMGIYRSLARTLEGVGIPDDIQLIQELAQKCGYSGSLDSLPKVADSFIATFDRRELFLYLRDKFQPFSNQQFSIFSILCRLPFKAIITACVDTMLEDEYERQGKHCEPVLRDADISIHRENEPLVIKLHGSLDDLESLAISYEDYSRSIRNRPAVFTTIKSLLIASTALFIGFDLEDHHFRDQYHEVTSWLGSFAPRAYAFEVEPSAEAWCRTHNVTPVQVQVSDLLKQLEDLVLQRPIIPLEYNDLSEAANAQLKRQLPPVQNGKYDPTLYINRSDVESELDAFLASGRNGLLLIGESGAGKTNLLCHQAEKWLNEGHVVLYYDCGGSLTLNVEDIIMSDLAPQMKVSFEALIGRIVELVKPKEKCVICLFDAINEFQDGEYRAADLLKRLDAIVRRTPFVNLKILISCRTGAWKNLDLLGRTSIFWDRYYPPSREPLSLLGFNPTELEDAYALYQKRYDIKNEFADLGNGLRNTLCDPLLLRITAMAYTKGVIPQEALSSRVIEDYFKQIRISPLEKVFLKNMAGFLLERGVQNVSLSQLLEDVRLRGDISDSSNSIYQRLKDARIIIENPGIIEPVVMFTYERILEYFIVAYWYGEINQDANRIAEYLSVQLPKYEQNALAWSAAVLAISMISDRETLFSILSRLSNSANYQIRQVVVESLVTLHLQDPAKAINLLRRFVQFSPPPKNMATARQAVETGMELPLRTVLKAARMIGVPARSIFLEAAANHQSSEQMDIVFNEMFILWQNNPDLGFAILQEIIRQFGFLQAKQRQLLSFAARFSLGLFANTCHRHDIVQKISDIWWDDFEVKYRMPEWFGGGIVDKIAEGGFRLAAQLGIADTIVDTITMGGRISLEKLFHDDAVKSAVNRLTDYLDPDTDIVPARADIAFLLSSDLIYPNTLAALVLSSHIYRDFGEIESWLDELFQSLPGNGRLWLLMSFLLLSPSPQQLSPIIQFTERIVRRVQVENREEFFSGPQDIFEQLDIGLLPLGILYTNSNLEMRYFMETIDHAKINDLPLLKRCLRGLSSIGIYRPDEVLDLLKITFSDELEMPEFREDTEHLLATIGTIFNDKVDAFLLRMGSSEDFRKSIQKKEDASLVKQYIDIVGLYNVNAYGSLYCPKLRRMIQSDYRGLTECKDAAEFATKITQAYIHLVVESNYRIVNMISPN